MQKALLDSKYKVIEICGGDVRGVWTDSINESYKHSKYTSKYLITALKKLFLPKGYPESVSGDYLSYQIWDTIQAFASSITGALASQAILTGVGVGDSSATVLAASFSWMLKDGTGMIGRIAFAGWKGTHLDSDCKFWRFVADILNDTAMFLELLSPLSFSFTFVISVANLLKCLVGVAGGATRATIAQHQAVADNLADVSAKDGSQETLSNLMAWCFNFCLLYYVIGNQILIWFGFVLLTIVHLYANYQAVKCLQFNTFNRARFHLTIQRWLELMFVSKYLESNIRLPSVSWANENEPILWSTNQPRVYLGCSYTMLSKHDQLCVSALFPMFSSHHYILYCPVWKLIQNGSSAKHFKVYILLHSNSNDKDQLKAMLHVELLCYLNKHHHTIGRQGLMKDIIESRNILEFTTNTTRLVDKLFNQMLEELHSHEISLKRWNINAIHFVASDWRIELMA